MKASDRYRISRDSIFSKIWKNSNFRLLIILLFFIVLFFSPIVFRDRYPLNAGYLLNWAPWSIFRTPATTFNAMLSDQIDTIIPWQEAVRSALASLRFPLWLSNIGTGTPLGTLLFSDTFSIVTLTKLFFGSFWGQILYIMFKLFLCGFFLCKLFRLLGIRELPSYIAAILATFSSFMIITLNTPVSDAYIYVPAVLYFGEKLLQKFSPKIFLLLSFLIVLTILSGFPSVTFYLLVAVCLYFFVRVVFFYRDFTRKQRIASLISVYASFLFAVLISMFSLLPTYEFFQEINISYRQAVATKALNPVHLGQILNPNFCGNYAQGTWRCTSNYYETPLYGGLITLIILPFAVIDKKLRKLSIFWVFTILLVFLIVFNIGPLLSIISKLPIFNINPSTRLISLLPLAFGFTTAIGLNATLETLEKRTIKKINILSIVSLLILLTLAFVPYIRSNYEFLLSLNPQFYSSNFGLSFWLFVIMIILILAIVNIKVKRQKIVLMVLLGFVSFFDLATFTNNFNSSSTQNEFYPTPPGIEFLQKNQQPHERMIAIERNIIPSTNLYYSINSLVGHWWVSREFKDMVNMIGSSTYSGANDTQPFFTMNTIDLESDLIDAFRIKYITLTPGDPRIWQTSYSSQREYNYNINLAGITSIKQEFESMRSGQFEHVDIRIYLGEEKVWPITLNLYDEAGAVLMSSDTEVRIDEYGWGVIAIEEFPTTEGQELAFEIIPHNPFPVNSVLFAVDGLDLYKNGTLYLDQTQTNQDLAFRVLDENPDLMGKYELVYDADIQIYRNNGLSESLPIIHSTVDPENEYCPNVIPTIDLRETAIISDFSLNDTADGEAYDASDTYAYITEYSSDKIQIHASSNRESVVILSDLYYPGWKAYVDGKKVDILRANCVMRGIPIEAGEHEIVMIYVPTSFYVGIGISVSTLTVLIVSYILYKRRKKSTDNETEA